MRISQITEAKFSKPIIAFHGTSSTFLKSILKTGMNPNPKKAVYDPEDDKLASEILPSLKTIGGTYWTTYLPKANNAATNATNKFDGNPIIVIAQIQLKSTFPDEDTHISHIDLDMMIRFDLNLKPDSKNYYHLFYDNPQKQSEIINTIANNIHTKYSNNSKKPIPKNLIKELINSFNTRILSHIIKNNPQTNPLEYTENKPIIPTISEAEENYRNSIDKITKYYRQHTITQYNRNKELSNKNIPNRGTNFRTTLPVTFSGNNQITHIIEILKDKIILQYGNKKNIPQELLSKLEYTFGKIPLVDKNDEPITSNKKVSEQKIQNTITLNDLYDQDELNDESETLYHWTQPEQFNTPYQIKIMQPNELKKLQTPNGDMTVLNAYKQFADKNQKQLVKNKTKNFDHNRIIVIANNTIIDGNHHIIAAILSNNPVKYIDIYEQD